MNDAFWNAQRSVVVGGDQRPGAVDIGRAQLLGEMLEHEPRDRATTRRSDVYAVDVRVVLGHLQLAANLGRLDQFGLPFILPVNTRIAATATCG
jgi:hypothetical protein